MAKKRGQPRKFDSPEQMQKAIDDYFDNTDIPTVCGMALHLGFISRQSFFDYKGYSEEFSYTITKAKLRIEKFLEETLHRTKPTGTIFNLKNNFKWQDKQDIEHSGELKLPTFTISVPNDDE